MPAEKKKIQVKDSPEIRRSAGGSSSKGEGEIKIDHFFAELKRRNVYKVAVAYIVGGWALAQGIAQVFPVFDVPNWAIRLIVLLIIVGLPIALMLAWTFHLIYHQYSVSGGLIQPVRKSRDVQRT